MNHKMNLYSEPFLQIYNNEKIIEVRLNDDKRRKLKVGDSIEFFELHGENRSIRCEVLELIKTENFEKLFSMYPFEYFGGRGYSMEDMVNSMYKFYKKEDEQKFGVLGIKIKVLKEEV